jgi:acyl carrier protein
VVAGLEEEFEISFADDTFEMEKFQSVASIARVVRDKLAAKGGNA